MVPRDINNAYAKFGGTNIEYYGIFRSGLFFALPQSLLVAQKPDLATERECQLTMARAAKISIFSSY